MNSRLFAENNSLILKFVWKRTETREVTTILGGSKLEDSQWFQVTIELTDLGSVYLSKVKHVTQWDSSGSRNIDSNMECWECCVQEYNWSYNV